LILFIPWSAKLDHALSWREIGRRGRLHPSGKLLTRKDLLVAVWGPAHATETQYLRVFVGRLRQKLEADPAYPKIREAEPGVGDRCIADGAATHAQVRPDTPDGLRLGLQC